MTDPDTSSSPAFDGASLAAAVGGRLLAEGHVPIIGAAADSRRVEPGNAFFALPGERTDGHRFAGDALRRGAAAIVVREPPEDARESLADRPGVAVIVVPDVLVALQRAAADWRSRFDPLVVGITGSLAKTSTKEQVAEVLSQRWNVLRNSGNENNEIGLPLTLMRLGPEHRAAVLEMGMYVPGDIALLASLARPSIGVVTAVRGAHLERAGTIDDIERGKRELVEALPANGSAVLNADDERVARMADHLPAGARAITYGFATTADVTANDVESLGAEGMRFTLQTDTHAADVAIPALGRHSVHNALAAAAVGIAAGIDVESIAAGLARPFSVPHRTTLIDLGSIMVLDDSYNASPDSMIAALDLLASLPGRHVAILGEMLELGGEAEAEHRRVGQHAGQVVDELVAVGPMADDYERGAREGRAVILVVGNRERLAEFPEMLDLRPGDVVLIKGSRGARMEELLPTLEFVAQHLEATVA